MALPENWETVHLVGHLVTDDNVPASAYSVRVQSSQTRLQDAVSHRLIFPGADTVTPDEGDGYFCIPAVISDTDTDITPAGRSHRITLLRGSTAVQSWFVSIDHAAATDMRFDTSNRVVSSGGALTPAIWMTDLWQFTDAPTVTPVNPGGGSADLSDYFTKAQTTAQITSALSSHGAEADPHPQYALPAEVAEAVAAGAPDATTTVKGKQVLLGGTADAPTVPYGKVTCAPTALPPSGGAGGVLSGNYPNPAFAVDMATQAELDAVSSAKADTSALTGHTSRTDNPHSTTKQQVGLGNVDNTSDAAKPVSSATQAALDAKTRLTVNGTFAGTYNLDTTPVTPADIGAQPADSDLTTIAALDAGTPGALATDGAGWIRKTYAQFKSALGLVKDDVGLGNVDNTSDAAKPVSTATQTALNLKADSSRTITAGTGLTGGGDLTANRTLAVSYGTASGTSAQGNDGRFSQVAANTQTGTAYTLVLADAGRAVEMNNAAANTMTVPPNSSVAFPVGTVIEVHQYGSGQTTVAAGAGVTLRAPDGLKLAKQYASASLRKRASDEWILAGAVTT